VQCLTKLEDETEMRDKIALCDNQIFLNIRNSKWL